MRVLLLLFGLVYCVFATRYDAVPIRPKDIPKKLSESRIINGSQSLSNQFPWQVTIRSSVGLSITVCGGSIISNLWILTAAHCTREYTTFQIGFGSVNLNLPKLTMTATIKIVHPLYNTANLNNDISLIKLPSAITYTSSIQAIRLPTLAQGSSPFVNYQAVVSGFGRTSDDSPSISTTLNYITMQVISNAECTTVYGNTVITPATICAIGWSTHQQNVCQGDSGGPLAIYENGFYTQIGVVSFVSSRGCSIGDPSGYVRTASFLEWIKLHTDIPNRV